MKEDVFTCDACEKSTTSPMVQKMWTNIELHIAQGMCRVKKTVDLCPECQDLVFSFLTSINLDATKGK